MRFYRIEENKELLGILEIFEHSKTRDGKRSSNYKLVEGIDSLTNATIRRIKDEAKILFACSYCNGKCIIYTEFGRVVDVCNQIPNMNELYLTTLRNIVRYNSIYKPDDIDDNNAIDRDSSLDRVILMSLKYGIINERPKYIDVTVLTRKELCDIMKKKRKMEIVLENMIPVYTEYTLLDGYPHIELVTDSIDRDDLMDKFYIDPCLPKRVRPSYSIL